jgi:hypothetical protein
VPQSVPANSKVNIEGLPMRSVASSRTTQASLGRMRALIALQTHDGLVGLSFARCFAIHLGLRLRQRQVKRSIGTTLRPYCRTKWRENVATTDLPLSDAPIGSILDCLAERLLSLATKPLTPAELLTVLPISNKERLTWTKDGRLTQSGSLTIKRGHTIMVPTYSVRNVETILAAPGIIEAWRTRDRSRSCL